MSEKLLTNLATNEEVKIVEIHGGRRIHARLQALGLTKGQQIKNCLG